MGLLDAPAPLFQWIDTQLGLVAPAGLRLALWGIAGGVVSMLIYRFISEQERVARAKTEIEQARRELDAYDGELAGAWPLMKRLLGLAVAQVGRVGWPAIVASLPLLCLLTWLSTAYGHRFPDSGAIPDIEVRPPVFEAEWSPASPAVAGMSGQPPRVLIRDATSSMVADIVLAEPVPVVHKRQWWNSLVSNPAGYLPQDIDLNRVQVALPRREFLPFGSDWMRGWEVVFFGPLLAASIALKILIRIE